MLRSFTSNHYLLSTLGAVAITLIWAGWIIISRVGVQTNLTPEDLTLIRYGTGTFFTLPFILTYNWRQLNLWKATVVALGCGFPYTLCSFYGLNTVKAANAGVIVNGMLPVFGLLLGYVALGERSNTKRLLAVVLILIANLIMMSTPKNIIENWWGWLMLLGASLAFSIYLFLGKRWAFSPRDVLVFLPLINFVLFLPWWFMTESGISETELSQILWQAAYQGVLVSVVALLITFYAMRHLGAMTLSIYFSFVPFLTAIMAFVLLKEQLDVHELIGIALCSVGLFAYSKANN